MKLSYWAVAIAVCIISAAGSSWIPDRGDEPDYWKEHSLVLASVVETQAVRGVESVMLQPIGTLSGEFDVGETSQVAVQLPQKDFWHTAYAHTGDLVLVILIRRTERRQSADGTFSAATKYVMWGYGAHYMPDRLSPMAVVHGTSDPMVRITLSAIRSLRATPRIESGKGEGYWLEHSLIVGEVTYYEPGIGGADGPRIRLKPIATLSGDFDAATVPVISVDWNCSMREEIDVRKPRANDKVLLVVQKNGSDQGWDSPEGRAAYMPGNHEAMKIVDGFFDPEIGVVLTAIQRLRKEPTATLAEQ